MPVGPEAERLLHLFAGKVGGRVTNLQAQQAVVEVGEGDPVMRLHFQEGQLRTLLNGAGEDGSSTWGEAPSDLEAAARFLALFLHESLATRTPDPTGWWEYQNSGFEPLPPWEASTRRRDRP